MSLCLGGRPRRAVLPGRGLSARPPPMGSRLGSVAAEGSQAGPGVTSAAAGQRGGSARTSQLAVCPLGARRPAGGLPGGGEPWSLGGTVSRSSSPPVGSGRCRVDTRALSVGEGMCPRGPGLALSGLSLWSLIPNFPLRPGEGRPAGPGRVQALPRLKQIFHFRAPASRCSRLPGALTPTVRDSLLWREEGAVTGRQTCSGK